MEFTVKTRFPLETGVTATVKAATATQARIRIRVPSWASGEMAISVNGKSAGTGKPGSYVALDRKWADRDSVELKLPASIRVKQYNGADQIPGKTRYSVEYGPILLAAVGASNVSLSVDRGHNLEDLSEYLQPIEGEPLHFSVRGNPGQKFIPYWQVSDEEFTCYPQVNNLA